MTIKELGKKGLKVASSNAQAGLTVIFLTGGYRIVLHDRPLGWIGGPAQPIVLTGAEQLE